MDLVSAEYYLDHLWDDNTEDEKMLLQASKRGNLQQVKYFIEKMGVSPNTVERRRQGVSLSVLYFAINFNHLDIVKYLLGKVGRLGCDRRAGLGCRDVDTNINAAIGNGNVEIIKLLFENIEGNFDVSPLLENAIKKGKTSRKRQI